MIHLRALGVTLSSAVVYSCVAFLTGNVISSVNAIPEPQTSLPAPACLISVLCCQEVTTFKENVCPLAGFIANEGLSLPDLSTEVGIDCEESPLGLGCTATPVCCSTTIPTPTNILSSSGVDCTAVAAPL